ncbi:PREDICTED: uncharacterized protein LOC109193147 [Ipomoea nil]|uniref:uncharacterized protein LOC109193147 n=1 Tax=Ipomoea nil TaxID=35883 RepID=UPI00085E9FE1|nr:PREDICTED: uncharacterized protein LOC109193147 [Ipomoea nil]
MAASRSYFPRNNYRFLSTDREAPIGGDSVFEFEESEVWNAAHSASPERRKAIPSSRARKPSAVSGTRVVGAAPGSLPVNVPDWSKILKDEYRENRRRDCDDDFDDEEEDGGGDGGDRVPPHEFVAQQLARTRIASFSVHEGIGRTLKGRDLSRVRNAIWKKTGFED